MKMISQQDSTLFPYQQRLVHDQPPPQIQNVKRKLILPQPLPNKRIKMNEESSDPGVIEESISVVTNFFSFFFF